VFKHILCPVDGSDTSVHALDLAAKLAVEQNASLTICLVVSPSKAAAMAFGDPAMSAMCFGALEDEGKSLVENATALVKDRITPRTAVLDGEPVTSIVDYAASNACDLIVMGSHGRGGIQRALIGSVAEGVLRHASVPVMVTRLTKRASPTVA
jgi:nucleotide-binding universal stress UspA family protein